MDATTRTCLDDIRSDERERQGHAFESLILATDQPVPWAYEAWDELLEDLTHTDNHVRAISAQVLANLAKSDPDHRMLKDFDRLLAVTRDERFVTARHCMQSLWKVGVAGSDQRHRLLEGLETRYRECISEKNCTLIRHDIMESLRKVYDVTGDESVKRQALEWIELEQDAKYKKKYAAVWRRR